MRTVAECPPLQPDAIVVEVAESQAGEGEPERGEREGGHDGGIRSARRTYASQEPAREQEGEPRGGPDIWIVEREECERHADDYVVEVG